MALHRVEHGLPQPLSRKRERVPEAGRGANGQVASGASRLSSSHCQRLRTSASSCLCFLRAVAEQFGGAELLVVLVVQRQFAGEEFIQRIQQFELVVQRQLDVDALDAVAIIAHARQRDHHVLVDLERVGVLGDGGGARAVQPEFLARLGGHGDKTFAAAQVGQAHDLRSGLRRRIRVVADHVGEQHHLRTRAALGFGGIAHRLQIALVEMLQSGQQRAGMRRPYRT